jgi:hypothetical protein
MPRVLISQRGIPQEADKVWSSGFLECPADPIQKSRNVDPRHKPFAPR